ncbi:MAG TPA: FKBP-type peptidyl-prolyl cis-trans isomerase [Flavisolibacter sp.]|nr:FKBP-type peptidyl-prolyl cis-trans isomerase [Flavisolibacter sp.]
MLKKILFGFVLISSLGGCLKGKENTFTCTYDACAVKAPDAETQAVQDYLTANNITNAQKHCSGFFYIIDNPGTGNAPTACTGVRATYKGTFTNGEEFDSGTADFGLNQVIRGWTNGLPLIKQGGKIRLFIPPSLGYGDEPYYDIPGKSILIFEVNLDIVY